MIQPMRRRECFESRGTRDGLKTFRIAGIGTAWRPSPAGFVLGTAWRPSPTGFLLGTAWRLSPTGFRKGNGISGRPISNRISHGR